MIAAATRPILRAFRIADAETDTDGNIDILTQILYFTRNLIRIQTCRARYALERNIIDKSACQLGNGFNTVFRRRRRNQENTVDLVILQLAI